MKVALARSAPHWRPASGVPAMMREVVWALLPAIACFAWFYGPGVLVNCLIACLAALATEAAALRLRGRAALPALGDGSAIVTALLLALALPPLLPWWITVFATVFAIAVAKHLYGGLGYNVFNPAMAGYVAVLVSFPDAMAMWPAGYIGDLDAISLGLVDTLRFTLTGNLPAGLTVDMIARPTALDSIRAGLDLRQTMDEIRASPIFGDFGGAGWEWVQNFVALGGFWLLFRGIIDWRIPVAVLAGLLAPATLFWLLDPATSPGPGTHLFTGGTMLCAFFIATDPVSASTTARGRLVYGVGIGGLTWVIREWGSWPDGIAFAVLLMNMLVPLVDRLTRPRVYGRSQRPGL
ncbi:MAG: RnfABCDGE type electron transport complex subunit D [Chromatiales bacterium]|nr:RnfABCDGE type electron transport complex subunit D [Chromatiales bacterium]